MFPLTRWLCVPVLAAACAFASGSAAAQTPITGPAGVITPPPDLLERQTPTPALGPGERLVDDMILDVSQINPLDWSGQTGAHFESFSARPWEFGVRPIAFDADVTFVDRERCRRRFEVGPLRRRRSGPWAPVGTGGVGWSSPKARQPGMCSGRVGIEAGRRAARDV